MRITFTLSQDPDRFCRNQRARTVPGFTPSPDEAHGIRPRRIGQPHDGPVDYYINTLHTDFLPAFCYMQYIQLHLMNWMPSTIALPPRHVRAVGTRELKIWLGTLVAFDQLYFQRFLLSLPVDTITTDEWTKPSPS